MHRRDAQKGCTEEVHRETSTQLGIHDVHLRHRRQMTCAYVGFPLYHQNHDLPSWCAIRNAAYPAVLIGKCTNTAFVPGSASTLKSCSIPCLSLEIRIDCYPRTLAKKVLIERRGAAFEIQLQHPYESSVPSRFRSQCCLQ